MLLHRSTEPRVGFHGFLRSTVHAQDQFEADYLMILRDKVIEVVPAIRGYLITGLQT